MDEVPTGIRRAEDESLFKRQTNDPSIQPDLISPAVEGYFRIPAVWIGDSPDPESVRVLNPNVHHAVVHQKQLRCGIEARVLRDGTFLFDFSSWPLAPTIEIPGYRILDPKKQYRIPSETTRKQEEAEHYAVLRAQVMNVHQACLSTSETAVKRRSAAMGFPVTAWNTHKALSFDMPDTYYDEIEDIHTLARNVLNNKDCVDRKNPFPRRVLELEVVEHSLSLLDKVLADEDALLLQTIESAYIGTCRLRDKRFGESITLLWGACEQLISYIWNSFLNDVKEDDRESGRMPKARREKLTGRDYTMSVIVELLEINEKIDHDLYRSLEVARKARNKWAHEMRVPKEKEILVCINSVQTLLLQFKGVQLYFQSGGYGGVPQWPVWLWEQVKTQNRS